MRTVADRSIEVRAPAAAVWEHGVSNWYTLPGIDIAVPDSGMRAGTELRGTISSGVVIISGTGRVLEWERASRAMLTLDIDRDESDFPGVPRQAIPGQAVISFDLEVMDRDTTAVRGLVMASCNRFMAPACGLIIGPILGGHLKSMKHKAEPSSEDVSHRVAA